MPTLNGDTLPYGQDAIIPTGARTAWGARLIVTQHGEVDLVPDRQAAAGEDRAKFLDDLGAALRVPAMLDTIGDLLYRGTMSTRQAQDFLIYADSRLEVHANTNASAGYCYVTAWATPKENTS